MTMIKFFRPRVVTNGNSPLTTWSDILDRYFENDNRLDYGNSSSPKVNIIENDGHYRIDMYVPGVSKADLKIEVEKDVLTISKPVKQDEEEAEYRLREFNIGYFERRFTLSDDIKSDEIKADYVNGILSVTLPKKEEAKPVKREISIQ
jgi:HSP20 family protein